MTEISTINMKKYKIYELPEVVLSETQQRAIHESLGVSPLHVLQTSFRIEIHYNSNSVGHHSWIQEHYLTIQPNICNWLSFSQFLGFKFLNIFYNSFSHGA
jgi:hypothetical protein